MPVNPEPPPDTTLDAETQRWLYENFLEFSGVQKVTGTFTSVDGKTITVRQGLVVSITE